MNRRDILKGIVALGVPAALVGKVGAGNYAAAVAANEHTAGVREAAVSPGRATITRMDGDAASFVEFTITKERVNCHWYWAEGVRDGRRFALIVEDPLGFKAYLGATARALRVDGEWWIDSVTV